LQAEKDSERNNLDNSLKSIRSKIQHLNKQIQELQKQDVDLSYQLSAIDQKYESQFIDIDRKINAIRDAK
jgi:predicted  nucleic acid-binding Zn-ribbon protein